MEGVVVDCHRTAFYQNSLLHESDESNDDEVNET